MYLFVKVIELTFTTTAFLLLLLLCICSVMSLCNLYGLWPTRATEGAWLPGKNTGAVYYLPL